ncbi:uncharacterized protein [Macrobrachium rosenbergii]|uniref:uncharacterized protein n=1 Tax=Macrobrachium rosenbergii TaxID=79674 RepID=UPI0034D3AF0B
MAPDRDPGRPSKVLSVGTQPAAGLSHRRLRQGNSLDPPGPQCPPPANNGRQKRRLKNPVADALSRIELNTVHLGINYDDLAQEQATNPEIPAYRTAITLLKWKDVPLAPGRPTLLSDDDGQASGREVHLAWHAEGRNGLGEAVHSVPDQQSRASHQVGVGRLSQPGRWFRHIHVDVVGPLPPSGGAKCLLTIIDCSTRWPEATPMEEATASCCAEALLSSLISRFGVPDHITTVRGPAFLSELWTALACLLGTTHHSTTAYNPAANGLVERLHRSLKASLMARCTAENWKYQLPWVLLGMRTTPRANGDQSAAEKV